MLISLPDTHDLVRRANHRAVIWKVERLLEFRRIRERAVTTILPRRVRIRVQAQAKCLFAHIGAPHLSPTKKETLLRCKAVDLLLRFPRARFLEGRESQLDPSVVGDVLTLREFAIDVRTGEGLVF